MPVIIQLVIITIFQGYIGMSKITVYENGVKIENSVDPIKNKRVATKEQQKMAEKIIKQKLKLE